MNCHFLLSFFSFHSDEVREEEKAMLKFDSNWLKTQFMSLVVVISFLLFSTPSRADEPANFSDENIAQVYVEILKTFEEMEPQEKSALLSLLFPEAVAEGNDVCLADGGYAGHGTYLDCKPDETPATCEVGSYSCNPNHYGHMDNGGVICLPKDKVGKYKTRACSNQFLAMAGVAPPIYRSDFSDEDYKNIKMRIKTQGINVTHMADSLREACSYHHAPSCYKTISLFAAATDVKCALPAIHTGANEIIKNIKKGEKKGDADGFSYEDLTLTERHRPDDRPVDELAHNRMVQGNNQLEKGRRRNHDVNSPDRSFQIGTPIRSAPDGTKYDEAYRYSSQVDGNQGRLTCEMIYRDPADPNKYHAISLTEKMDANKLKGMLAKGTLFNPQGEILDRFKKLQKKAGNVPLTVKPVVKTAAPSGPPEVVKRNDGKDQYLTLFKFRQNIKNVKKGDYVGNCKISGVDKTYIEIDTGGWLVNKFFKDGPMGAYDQALDSVIRACTGEKIKGVY